MLTPLRHKALAAAAAMAMSAIMVPNTCFARIGETLSECQTRYGVIVSVVAEGRQDYPQFCFRMGEVNIRVRIYNEKSAQEIFYVDGRRLTTAERDLILNSNLTGNDVTYSSHSISKNEDMLLITTREFERVFHKESGSNF